MEGLSMNAYKGIRGYWKKKKGYERLNGPTTKARLEPAQDPGGGGGRRRRRRWRWRFKIGRKIRVGSPKKWLTRLRDAYVKMMLKFANSTIMSGGYGAPVEYGGFGKNPAAKEYDEKVLVEIYKSVLMAQAAASRPDQVRADTPVN